MSDNDLIRRGDALKALHYDVGLGTAHPAYECIAALPAVTPALGLKHIGTGLYETQSDYRLAPHLQKIVDGAKTAPQWDTQADRLAPTDAATEKGGDAHAVDPRHAPHEASPGVTAGADAAQAREAALHPDDMLPEAIRLIRQEASRDHSQDVVTGLKHIALLLEQLISETRT